MIVAKRVDEVMPYLSNDERSVKRIQAPVVLSNAGSFRQKAYSPKQSNNTL